MKIDANLTFNKVQFDQETEAHLVLSLTAPAVSIKDKRPPLCITPLVDISGSMEGEKLVYAKRSLIKLLDHLSANDYCGLIAFSNDVQVVSKPVKCTVEAKEDLKRKVGDLRTAGSTNIADALLSGFELVSKMDLPVEAIIRVILFTDGAANVGPAIEPKDIVALVGPNIGNASVSAFGYGSDARQDFLLDLAKTGKGNYAFIQNPDDALSTFGKELEGLLSTYATNLVLDVTPLAGHRISQVVSDVTAEEDDLGQVTIRIPDVLSEETRNLVLAVKLQSQKNAFPRAVNVFDVKMGYDMLDANFHKEHQTIEAKVKVQFVKAEERDTAPNPDLDRIVGLAQIVRAQIEAEEQAKKGDFVAAAGVMSSIANNVKTRGLVDLGVMACGMGQRMASQSLYASNASYFASVQQGVTRSVGGTYSADATHDLKTVGMSLSNAAQDSLMDSFTNEPDDSNMAVLNPFTVTDIPDLGTSTISVSGSSIDPLVNPDPNRPLLWMDADHAHEVEEEEKVSKDKSKISKKSKRW